MVITLTLILQGLNEHTDVTEHLNPLKNPLKLRVFLTAEFLVINILFSRQNFKANL